MSVFGVFLIRIFLHSNWIRKGKDHAVFLDSINLMINMDLDRVIVVNEILLKKWKLQSIKIKILALYRTIFLRHSTVSTIEFFMERILTLHFANCDAYFINCKVILYDFLNFAKLTLLIFDLICFIAGQD